MLARPPVGRPTTASTLSCRRVLCPARVCVRPWLVQAHAELQAACRLDSGVGRGLIAVQVKLSVRKVMLRVVVKMRCQN